MQPLEFSLVLAGTFGAVLRLAFNARETKWISALALLLGGLAGAQLYLEGYRWHMLAAYIGIAVIVAVVLLSRSLTCPLLKVLAVFSLFCFAASAVAAGSFPVFKFPALTGRYQVGTLTLEFKDSLPEGSNSTAGPGRRELVVQMFYPAEPAAEEQRSSYALAGLATRFKPQLAKVRTRAFVNAKIARSEQRYPVLVYSHSWNGSRLEDLFVVLDLASHGYVVACVDDPYDTPITILADGRVLRHPGDHWLDFSSPRTLQDALQRLKHNLAVRVADVSFVLDQLIRLNANDISGKFYGLLDTNRAGIIGFSFGGTTAAQACRADQRFKAGVDLDGYSFAIADVDRIGQPFLIMADSIAPDEYAAARDPEQRAEARFDMIEYRQIMQSYGGYLLVLKGTQHVNFSDFPLYSRLRFYTGAGPIDPRRAMSIIDAYVLCFFDKNLRGEPAPLLEGPTAEFPEVEFVLKQKTATTSSSQ
jgi:dienelactone hydrolase